MQVRVVIPPQPIVTVPDAKTHLRVDGDGEDNLIALYIAAATSHIDGPGGWLGRCIGAQTLELITGASSSIRLPFPPAIDLVSATYLDAAGAPQDADLAGVVVYDRDLMLLGSTWPWQSASDRPDALRIRYTAGYSMVPAAIQAAVLLMVGDLYNNRETTSTATVTEVPMSTTVQALLAPYRVYA